MGRRRTGSLLLLVGAVLLAASLGQYGFMFLRQRSLRQRVAPPLASAPVALPAESLRLVIPRIGLDDAVVYGTTYEDLLEAPGLLEGTPPPGQAGNSVIAAHRDTFFRHLADLNVGDLVRVWRGPAEFDYRIASRSIVRPTDTAVLDPTPAPRLTLITCYPTYWIGPAPKRLVLTAAPFARPVPKY